VVDKEAPDTRCSWKQKALISQSPDPQVLLPFPLKKLPYSSQTTPEACFETLIFTSAP